MHTPDFLPAGKLPNPTLDALLRSLPSTDPRLVVGPQAGVDAAVIDFGSTYLVVKTDPITFASDEIGWYAVNVNANDLAVMGATPRWFLATLLLPAGQATTALATRIHDQIVDACRALNVALVGGHSEITAGIDRPIVSGVMLGEVEPARLLRSSAVQPGDWLVLAGYVPVEGTALLAREKAGELLARGVDADVLRRAQDFLHRPGISVVAAAHAAARVAGVHAMHDPTEGGLATALAEMAHASGVGMMVDFDAVPIPPESAALCEAYGLDPMGVLASGALLVAVDPDAAPALLAALYALAVPAHVIGHATAPGSPLVARRHGSGVPFPHFAADEITRTFS